MNAAQRIRLIRIIEKIEKNPEFSNKLGVKNTSDFISDKQRKNESLTIGWVLEGEKDVNSIIYYLYDLVCWKIFCFWVKSILGNYETTVHSYFLPGDIDWYGYRWTDVHCFPIIDHWWHYSIGDITFIMAYFNFSFSAFKSSRLSPCSPAVLSTQRFKESMAKEISSSFLLI